MEGKRRGEGTMALPELDTSDHRFADQIFPGSPGMGLATPEYLST
jgi:hypothetical protein